MEEMKTSWGWSGRCLRSLQSLVKEWNVDMNACPGDEPTEAAPPPVAAILTEPQRVSPLAERNSDGLPGGGESSSLGGDKYRFQETVWGLDPLTAAGSGVLLEDWAVEVPGSDQFDASFVDLWWEDATM